MSGERQEINDDVIDRCNLTQLEIVKLDELLERLEKDKVTMDETLAIQSILARDLDVDAAFKVYTKFLTIKETYALDSIGVDDMEKELGHGKVAVLPGRAKGKYAGAALILFAYANHIPAESVIKANMQYTLTLMLEQMRSITTCRNGIVYLADMGGVGFGNFNVDDETIWMDVMTTGFPLKIRCFYIFNIGIIFWILLGILIPFAGPELQKIMVIVYSQSSYEECLDPALVPSFLTKGTYELDWKQEIGRQTAMFKAMEDRRRRR